MTPHRAVANTLMTRVQVTALTVLQSVAFTRLLGAEGRGLYAKLQAGLSLGMLLFGFGITTALANYIASKKIETSDVLSLAFWIWLIGSGLMLITMVVFHLLPEADLIFPIHFRTPEYLFYFYASYVLTALQLSLTAAVQGDQQFERINFIELATTALRTGLFLFLLLAPKESLSIRAIFATDLALVLVKTASFLILFTRVFSVDIRLRLANLRSCFAMFHFSSWIYTTGIVTFLYLRIDYWLIERILGLKVLGIYSVASGLAQYMTIIPIALASVMVPMLSSSDASAQPEALRYFSRLNVSLTGLMALALVVLAHPLIRLLYSAEFSAAEAPLRILAPSFFFISVKFLFTNYNVSAGKFKHNMFAELLGLAVGLSFNVILLPKIGILGACWASLAANFTASFYIIVQILKDDAIPNRGLILIRREDLSLILSSFVRWQSKEAA